MALALVASTTAATPRSASSRPSPVSRSTPSERPMRTASWPRPSRADTVRAPMWPVAPATAMRMLLSLRLATVGFAPRDEFSSTRSLLPRARWRKLRRCRSGPNTYDDLEADMATKTPRTLISAMQVTLDGYVLGPKGESDGVDSWADGLELLPPVDAFVLGGGMFPQYEQFWAAVLDNPGAAADMLGRDPYPRELN